MSDSKLPKVFRTFKEQVEKLIKGESIDYSSLEHLFTSRVDFLICKEALSYMESVEYDLECPNNPYMLIISKHYYIVGVNEDGKLFCHIADYSRVPDIRYSNEPFYHEDVLGYQYDSCHLLESGAYRVQGDLVLDVERLSRVSLFHRMWDMIFYELLEALEVKVHREIVTKVSKLLSRLRIGATLDYTSHSAVVSIISHNPFRFKVAPKTIHMKISKLLGEYKRIGDVYIYTAKSSDRLAYQIEYRADCDKIRGLYRGYLDNIVKSLLEKKEEKTIIIGNHTIRAFSYPTEVAIELPDLVNDGCLMLRTSFVSFPNRTIITDEELIVEHDEHSTVRVVLESDDVYIIEPRFTFVSERDIMFRNTYALESLERGTSNEQAP